MSLREPSLHVQTPVLAVVPAHRCINSSGISTHRWRSWRTRRGETPWAEPFEFIEKSTVVTEPDRSATRPIRNGPRDGFVSRTRVFCCNIGRNDIESKCATLVVRGGEHPFGEWGEVATDRLENVRGLEIRGYITY